MIDYLLAGVVTPCLAYLVFFAIAYPALTAEANMDRGVERKSLSKIISDYYFNK